MPALKSPLCFVLMPFGVKPAAGGLLLDFDAIYREVIEPGITDAKLSPLRADQELTGGIIHKPMYERLILCEYAVADLTTANANVFYELGLRHAVRPASTLLMFAEGVGQLPFDVSLLRALPYKVGADGRPANAAEVRKAMAARLQESRQMATDSPVFQLVENYPDIKRLKTDVFRERVEIGREMRERLLAARKAGLGAVQAIERELAEEPGGIADTEAGVVVDLFLSYRAVEGWDDMIALVKRMSPPLARSVMVQEQIGLALNRARRGEEAERVLREILDGQGPSSETYGILGRVYKDRWKAAMDAGDTRLARGLLGRAIDAYLRGFQVDWRDAYPGVNAVTLMELADPPDPRRTQLLPVVAYAVERRIASGQPDYWDFATRLELAVLSRDEAAGLSALGEALASVREAWEPKSTANNLRLIREARERRGERSAWAAEAEAALDRRSAP